MTCSQERQAGAARRTDGTGEGPRLGVTAAGVGTTLTRRSRNQRFDVFTIKEKRQIEPRTVLCFAFETRNRLIVC